MASLNSQDNEEVGASYSYIRVMSADDILAIAPRRENTERNRRERAADPPQQDDSGDTEHYEMPDKEIGQCGRPITVQSEQTYIDVLVSSLAGFHGSGGR
jgi:hypothetical protein